MLTLVLGFAAVNTGNNLLYLMVSALLGFMAASGWCGHANLSRLELRLLPSRDLYAATPGTVRLRIANRRRFPTYLLQVKIADTGVVVSAIPGADSTEIELSVTLPQRGLCPLPLLHLSSCFPVNFFVRYYPLDLQQSLLVFPRPIATSMPLQRTPLATTADNQTTMAGGDGDLRTIDDYRAGDPPKAIHWKLSARHQELKSKRMNHQADEVSILDPALLEGSLEERLGRCAYLINRCSNDHRAVGLILDGRWIAPRTGNKQRLRLLKELALYE